MGHDHARRAVSALFGQPGQAARSVAAGRWSRPLRPLVVTPDLPGAVVRLPVEVQYALVNGAPDSDAAVTSKFTGLV